jgi:glyoxylase-like metal-dependent hydrolase (beta-lactamase superfamily II)
MKRLAKTFYILLSLISANAVVAKDEISLKSTELASGIYMIEGVGGFTGGNIVLSVGDEGVVMIDDGLPPFLGLLQDAIKAITPKPINYLINTHIHGDHTGNNANFGASKTNIVAHQNMRSHMKERGIPGSDNTTPLPASALPVITFSEQMEFHLNGSSVKLVHVPHAHTDGDSIVIFTGENIIHSGDVLFNGLFPYIDLASGGSVEGYLAAQKFVYSLADNQTKIVPGHGPLATKENLKASIDMLEDSTKLIRKLLAKGLTENEVVALNPLGKYHDNWSWGFINTEKMTRTLYQDMMGNHEDHTHADEKHNH